ncbi:hypothetical protein ACIBCT_37380 [Streptosporangium sp. NPDC050855]|uniref:hypothetical protein n=1 Tax=Streptosporangium sp. NPDC050855 TaxID=3366194 RepID=UPI0037A14718
MTASYRLRYPTLAAMAGEGPLADVCLEVSFERPTFHGHERLTVRPGVVDEAAIELYAYSSCVVLARALHWRTGWPLALLEVPGPPWRWAHVGVITPAGDVLDIYGIRPVEQVMADIEREHDLQIHIRPIPTLDELFTLVGEREADRRAWLSGSATSPLAIELSGVFADLLLAQAEAEAAEAVSI